MRRKYPTLDDLIQSERREAFVALRHLAGESIDSEPLYFRATDGRSILTYAGSLNLAKLLGIERIYETFKSAPQSNCKVAYFAVVKCQLAPSHFRGRIMPRCKSCDAKIKFIRTEKGRAMPEDIKPITVITSLGKTIKAFTPH